MLQLILNISRRSSPFPPFGGISTFPSNPETRNETRSDSHIPTLTWEYPSIPQPPLNAQMLAQRQRELYSQQHRQRQLMQQRALLLRQQSFGNASGIPVPLGATRLPQAPPQQFPYPVPSYGAGAGNPPSAGAAGPFSGAEAAAALAGRRGSAVGAQFGAGMVAPGMQQNVFQYSGAGLAQQSESFAPALSPGSPLVSPQIPPAQSPMLPPAPPAPGYQSPDVKGWQQGAMGNNSVFSPAGAAPAAPAQPGMYNNMSITVSMAGGGSGVPTINPMGGQVPGMNPLQMPGMNSMCSEQVPDPALRPAGLYCNQLNSSELLKAEADGAQVSNDSQNNGGDSQKKWLEMVEIPRKMAGDGGDSKKKCLEMVEIPKKNGWRVPRMVEIPKKMAGGPPGWWRFPKKRLEGHRMVEIPKKGWRAPRMVEILKTSPTSIG
ncbi:nuclear receptor coactivator 1-like isoform X2 [Corapipo altera]|uniref:nuclear receptor coactivator 1-like isoform X2 n=2 Tax=Corapipo altera TaxID=415028 RepID=UPI000FD65E67|nr:nuclear receptor coactivator 1-like isoform X2 [Corapipo altera]